MTLTKPILLAEDNPRDAELALAAMEEHHLADKVILCHDGAEVLDYLYCRGHFKARLQGNPSRVKEPNIIEKSLMLKLYCMN